MHTKGLLALQCHGSESQISVLNWSIVIVSFEKVEIEKKYISIHFIVSYEKVEIEKKRREIHFSAI